MSSSAMLVTQRLLKSWWPNAGSSTILNLELPIISIITTYFSYSSLIDYANALAIFLFSNAFIYPITTVVIKNAIANKTWKFSIILSLSIFFITNVIFFIYSLIYNCDLMLNHIFSFSLIAVGMRRYLHGVLILKETTSIIFPASIVRLIISTSACYLLITRSMESAYAPIVALVTGAWIESLILFLFVKSKGYSCLFISDTVSQKGFFRVYFAAFFFMVSALMSNSFITYLINASGVSQKELQLESWAVLFGVICVCTSSIFDIENFIIRYYKNDLLKSTFIIFLLITFFTSIMMAAVYIFILLYVISPGALFYLKTKFVLILLLSGVVSFLWLLRSYTRARLIISDKTKRIIASVGLSFLFSFFVSECNFLSHEYQFLMSFVIYTMLIAFEFIINLLFLYGPFKITLFNSKEMK